MKPFRKSIFLITVFVLSVSMGPAQTEVITLMHINDTHSNLAAIGPRTTDLKGSLGGLARVATVVNRARLHDRDILLLHSGDLFIGDLFFNKYFGVPELKTLQLLGFDAMAVGNHEFDLTPAVLLQSLETAFPRGGFPLLSANLNLDAPEVQPLKKHIHPYIIRRVGSVKVGIFGLTTPATNLLSQPSPAYVDEHVFEIAASTVEFLKGQGCHVVICLSHLGVLLDQALAQNIPGINVIVGGHDHFLYDKPIEITNPYGETTWIVQANAFYLNLGKMKIKVHNGKVRLLDYELIKIDSSIPEAPLVAATVRLLLKGIENSYGPVYTQQVAYATAYFEEVAKDLSVAGPKDTPIGNLVTDAFRAATGTDVAIEVGGSTAQPLYPGPLVAADLFRVVGYGFNTENGLGFRIATFKMYGEALWSGLEFGVSGFEENYDEFLVQASGIKYTYDPARPPFSRVNSVEVNGQPLNPYEIYTVTANEFVPIVLDKLGIPYSDLSIIPATTEFQVLTSYAAQVQVLSPKVEGRVLCVPPVSPKVLADYSRALGEQEVGVPASFALEQNYPNPFNPNTTITFALPTTALVTLRVYNVLGQEVGLLVNEQLPAGQYVRTFRADNLASGTYLYRLTAGDASTGSAHGFVQTKRMVIMK
jgi:2',3'-cyclic-nucleotide 2'-phosphodiesterase (5'-nucleotidase family)